MNIQLTFIGFLIFFGCTETKVPKESKSYTPDQCILQTIRDSTIPSQDLIIGYQFVCGGNDTIDTFMFFEDNPWLGMGFPILPEKTRYMTFSNNYKSSLIQGFIPFDLTKSTFDKLMDKFSFTKNKQMESLIPVTAWTECRYKYSHDEVLLVNYILSIHGVTDTLTLANPQMIHTESQLKVFLSNGESSYTINSKEFARTGAILDSSQRFLFLRTLRPHTDDGITGIDIRDIQRDSILFQLEMDSSFLVENPKLYENYIVYMIYSFISANDKDGIRPSQILVFDIANRKMLKRDFKEDFKFTFDKLSDGNLLYWYAADAEEGFEYDTFKITDMEEIYSPTQISQRH